MDQTNLIVSVGQIITPPGVHGTIFNNGQKRRWIWYDCDAGLNHYEYATVFYTPSDIYFSPPLPSLFTNVGTYTFTAKMDEIPSDTCSSISGIVIGTLTIQVNPADSDYDGDGMPDGWEWNNFGNLNQTATGDYDNDGVSNLGEFNGGTDPNSITFSIITTNNYVNSSFATIQVNIVGGVPASKAVLVDSTNFTAATWTSYTSSNITVNLGSIEGWHDVWLGLRGNLTTSEQAWQWKHLKLDKTPPLLVITNPAAGTVSQPIIELQGYCPEPLADISYDITNAAGLATNQQVLVLDQFYDTNIFEFTTNTFQAFDIPVTNGPNVITLHATDLAGNLTATNFSYTLDYSTRTNPPVIQIYWPQDDGAQISGTTFTWRGWLSDFTATVTAQIVDVDGNTNIFEGIVERDGHFWIEKPPGWRGNKCVHAHCNRCGGQRGCDEHCGFTERYWTDDQSAGPEPILEHNYDRVWNDQRFCGLHGLGKRSESDGYWWRQLGGG